MTTNSQNSQQRFERKFLVNQASPQEIEVILAANPAAFSEIHQSRFINNIYFDTPSFNNYRDSIEGNSNRFKARIRWYGDRFDRVSSPAYEIKRKSGLCGHKETYALGEFMLDAYELGSVINQEIAASEEMPLYTQCMVQSLSPVLFNRYRRKYYLSADGKYRLTVDSLMEYTRIGARNSHFLHKSRDHESVIIEIKYAPVHDTGANEIAQHWPYRVSKSSKYVTGVSRLYF